MAGRRRKIKNLAWGAALCLGALLGVLHPLISEETRARFADGRSANGTLDGTTPSELRFVAGGDETSLTGIRRIEFPARSPVLGAFMPARVFQLRGGERITAEWRRLTEDEITLLWRGNEITLPRHAVLAINQLPTELQELFEDFSALELSSAWKASGRVMLSAFENRNALRLKGKAALSHSLKQPLSAGRVSLAFVDPSPKRENANVGLELNFGDEKTSSTLTIHLAATDEFYGTSHSPSLRLTRQPLRRSSGRHHVTVLFDETRFQVLIDSHLLASGRPLGVPLTSFRLVSEPVEGASVNPAREFWLLGAMFTQFLADQGSQNQFSQGKQAQVLTERGETLYGDSIAVDAKEVRLQGAFGEVALPWGQVRRVVFAEAKRGEPLHPDPKSTPVGWQAAITFQRFVDHPHHVADRLSGTLLAADADSVTLAHSWLGTHEIPREHLDVIAPKFYGSSLIMSADATHLGNQIKTGFLHQIPEGAELNGEFHSENVPLGAAFVRIAAAELEPARKDTPPGSRFLAELRNGGLGTEFILNGTSLGRLNDMISRKANRESPRELRLAVPADLLRSGRNTWAIRQTAMRNHPQEFDDCELGPIVLEIEQTPRD